MRSLQTGAPALQSVSVSHQTPGLRPDVQPRRQPTLMRKYEIVALNQAGQIIDKQVIAPATPMFEDTASAFARGTLISTRRGPMAVEDLLPGDEVETGRGYEAVTWIGSTIFVPGTGDRASGLSKLYRITAEAFGFNRPMCDILVGPAARMSLRRERLRSLIGRDTVLVPVHEYCDGDRIFEVNPPSSVQMYHIALERHGTIQAAGYEMESYHPGRNAGAALGQNMRALFLSMFPNVEQLEDFGELTLTRTSRDVLDNLMVG